MLLCTRHRKKKKKESLNLFSLYLSGVKKQHPPRRKNSRPSLPFSLCPPLVLSLSLASSLPLPRHHPEEELQSAVRKGRRRHHPHELLLHFRKMQTFSTSRLRFLLLSRFRFLSFLFLTFPCRSRPALPFNSVFRFLFSFRSNASST